MDVFKPKDYEPPSYVKSIMDGYKSAIDTKSANEDLLSKMYTNKLAQAESQYAPQFASAKLEEAQAKPGLTRAQANQANAYADWQSTDTQRLKSLLPFYPKEMQANIAEKIAMANLNNMGGRGVGTGQKEEMFFQHLIGLDNPHLQGDPEKIYEAANVLRTGGNQLSDGTPINISEASKMSRDRLIKGTTTAQAINRGLQANQAEAEVPVIDKYISEGRKPYGFTIGNWSPQLTKDSLKINDNEAQKKVGRYWASNLLNFDKAALQTRIAGTESGVTILNEIMNKAQQQVNSDPHFKTDVARQEALETVSKAMNEMLAARNKVGISPSNATGVRSDNKSSGKVRKYNLQTGSFE